MARPEERREVWYVADSDQIVQGIHPRHWCSGTCVVHRPSAHHMRGMPLGFDVKAKAFFRTCKHGDQHQDPDERTYWTHQLERDVAKGGKGGGGKLAVLAMEKLSAWYCPSCECGCCDLTSIA